MGFLKFMKRNNAKQEAALPEPPVDELDTPPLPGGPLGSMPQEPLSDIPMPENMDDLPDFPEIPEPNAPAFNQPMGSMEQEAPNFEQSIQDIEPFSPEMDQPPQEPPFSDIPDFNNQEHIEAPDFNEAHLPEEPEMPERMNIEPPSAPDFSEQDFPEDEPLPKPPASPTWDDFDEEPIMESTHRDLSDINGPLFILSEQFQRVNGRILGSKELLKQSADKLTILNEIKVKEDKQYSAWKKRLEDIQRKLIYIDKKIFNEGV